MRRRAAAVLVASSLALAASGENELKVEPRRVPADESVRITLVLRDAFASIDAVDLPLENLELRGPASTSVEVSFVNGVAARRKTLTWWASPAGEGRARVGPLVLTTGSARDELPAVDVTVAAEPAIDSSNLAQAFDQLFMTGRDRVILAVDTPRREVWQGEGIDVEWSLYTAASIRRYVTTSSPKLDGFWIEEEPIRDAMPEDVTVGGHTVQKIVIRRATLFPLRSGSVVIPTMEAGIEVIRPLNDPFGGFSLLEGRVVDVRRKAAPVTIVVKPLPGKFETVGSFTMRRSAPKVSGSGTAAFDLTVSGAGNLRSANPPRWVEPVDGEVQVEELGTAVTSRGPMTMSRRWRYVVFPRSSGPLALPPLELRSFDPATGAAAAVRCAAAEVVVTRTGETQSEQPGGAPARETKSNEWLPPTAALAGLLACTLLAAWLLRGKGHDADELEGLMSRLGDPRELRRALAELATKHRHNPRVLFVDAGELGDAWRSVHSFADLVEKEPASLDDARRELKRRAVRLLPLLRQ